jgi:hypothetical protein
MKISDCINELTELWCEWLKTHHIVTDRLLSIRERRMSAEKCERLIEREREIIRVIDKMFEVSHEEY